MYLSIQKVQGTTARFICETYPQIGETVEMAKWYKNGIELRNPMPRITLTSTNTNIDGKLLYFSILEPEDEVIIINYN